MPTVPELWELGDGGLRRNGNIVLTSSELRTALSFIHNMGKDSTGRPNDRDAMLIFADWLDDRGWQSAAAGEHGTVNWSVLMAQKIKVYVRTTVHGSDCVDYCDLPDDWDAMSDTDREEYLRDLVSGHLQNNAEYGAYVVDQ